MKYNKAITEGGFLTTEGAAMIKKTLLKGLEEFFQELAEEELTHQQFQTIKSITLQVVSENIYSRKK